MKGRGAFGIVYLEGLPCMVHWARCGPWLQSAMATYRGAYFGYDQTIEIAQHIGSIGDMAALCSSRHQPPIPVTAVPR